jgi:SRSO17 transposase
MQILKNLVTTLRKSFGDSEKEKERAIWFSYTLMSIIIPFTGSKASQLLRCLKVVFGFKAISKRRFYIFMASPKIPWEKLWKCVWTMIPDPVIDGKIFLALDDFINPKTGKKIFGCHRFFDHAAKQNESRYPWSQNVVAIGLLKSIKDRWACLPLASRFYHLEKDLKKKPVRVGRKIVEFKTKFEQAVEMIKDIAGHFPNPIVCVTDSWFGNNGLFSPMRELIGERFHMLSRLRANITLYQTTPARSQKGRGRPRKYGKRAGSVSDCASRFRRHAKTFHVNLYGRVREIFACERTMMLKTLKCPVKVVWVFRKKQWVALFSTDLTMSLEKIVEYYGARWKIESGFKELKQDLGSNQTQARDPHAVINHINFCQMAATIVWIYGDRIKKKPHRRHSVKGRSHFAFSDVRRLLAEVILDGNFDKVCPMPRKSRLISLFGALLRMAA